MLKVFTVYDSKAEAFIQPFYAQATGAAIRDFAAAANKEDHNFHIHAGDYTLFELGEFNQSSGQIDLLDALLNLGTALSYIEQAYGERTDDLRAITGLGTARPKTRA